MEKHRIATLTAKEADLRKNFLIGIIIAAEIFAVLFMSFPRLDDLTWGSEIGLQRLSTWFAGYNGRYTGNIIVIVLTRLPIVVRACVELMVLCTLFYYAHRLLPRMGMFCTFVLALLTLPLELYAQSVVWTAGFANYATSATVLLFVLDTCCRVVFQKEKLSKIHCAIFLLVVFFGQLILENTTICIVAVTLYFCIYSWIKREKICAPLILGLIAATGGAVLMFSDSSYYSALMGDGKNYKAISTSVVDLLKKYQNEVAPHLVQNNHLLNFALAVALLLLWLTMKTRNQKAELLIRRIGCFLGGVLCAFFCYDMVDGVWTRVIPHGKTVYAVITFLYAIYIVATILITIAEKNEKTMILLLSFSQVVLAAPLVVATPLNARCFFQNGILWCMILGYILQVLADRCNIRLDRAAMEKNVIMITQIVCVCWLAFLLCGQSSAWKIQKIRQEITQSSLESGAEAIVLPEVPWSSIYCYGANISNTNTYWLTNYKRYYGIPDDTKLSFMDYYKWMEQYGDQWI